MKEYFLRPVEPGDARDANIMHRMPGVFENTLGIPTETCASSERFFSSFDSDKHHLAAVIIDDDGRERVIGMCGLTVQKNARCRHVASLGMMVHPEWQNQGVGSRLLESVLDIADNWLKLKRVELCVFIDNSRAIRLYEKFGFEKEGTKRFAAVRHGEYVDEYLMARIRKRKGKH